MNKYLYLTIGIPGSKKTTKCRKISQKEKDIVVLSIDDFRLAFYKEQYNEKI